MVGASYLDGWEGEDLCGGIVVLRLATIIGGVIVPALVSLDVGDGVAPRSKRSPSLSVSWWH